MECVAEERHHLLAQQRDEDKDSPQAVDDAWNGSEQIDEESHRLTQPCRRELGQKDRDANCQRRRDDQRNRGRDERSKKRGSRAEMSARNIPVARRHDRQSQLCESRPGRREDCDGDRNNERRDYERAGCSDDLVNSVANRSLLNAELATVVLEPLRWKRGHFVAVVSIVASLLLTLLAISLGNGA